MQPSSFKYVYIPADVNEPIQELELHVPEGKEVECLLDHLKKHFNQTNLDEKQREAKKKALLEQLGDKAAQVDMKMLDMAADLQMVENISLLANHKDVGYVGVNMYCDDQAQAKQLPFNPRASGLAEYCGKMIRVAGDAFIARVFDNDDQFERRDFFLSEVSSTAAWVLEAQKQAFRRQAQPDAQTLLKEVEKQAGISKAGTKKSEAELAKDRGNAAVKEGRWEAALQEYNAALAQQPDMIAAVSNRALVHLKMGKAEDAIQDCCTVLTAEPDNVKALLRRAAAYELQGSTQLACQDYQRALKVQPNNKEAAAALDRLKPPPSPTSRAVGILSEKADDTTNQ